MTKAVTMKKMKKANKIQRHSDCVHDARRDLEWHVDVPSSETRCAIRAHKATTLQVIQGSMHVGHAQNVVTYFKYFVCFFSLNSRHKRCEI